MGIKLNLSPEEIEDIANQMVEQFKEEEKNRMDFYQNHINVTIEKVLGYIKDKDGVDSEDLSYFPEKFPFQSSDYWYVFDFFADYGQEKGLFSQDSDNYFKHYNYHIEYKGVKYSAFIMWGQGCVSSLRLANEEDWNEDKKIDFEACCTFWAKQVKEYEEEN